MAKTLTFGVYYESWGRVTVDIPDEIQTKEEAVKYIQEHWDEVSFPKNTEYVDDSIEMDEDGEIEFSEEGRMQYVMDIALECTFRYCSCY